MALESNASINRQITQTQDKINGYLYRVEYLEKRLRNMEMSMEQRIKLEDELSSIRNKLEKSEDNLKECYSENRKTMIFVVICMFFSFLFYVVYVMIVGPK